MPDNITINSVNSDTQPVGDLVQPLATHVAEVSDTAPSDAATASLEQATTALVQYVQTVMAPTDGAPVSDNTEALREMATAFMQQTATAISTSVTESAALQSSASDKAISSNLSQATSSFVENLGDLLINPNASDTDPTALMKDVQEIWKNKSPTDTVVSTAASIWESVKTSQHLPVIAGMLASVIFKKK
jgi:hypothetical protein